MVEAVATAVVGVGDFGWVVLVDILPEEFQFVMVLSTWIEGAQVGQVAAVHGEDEIKFEEVGHVVEFADRPMK